MIRHKDNTLIVMGVFATISISLAVGYGIGQPMAIGNPLFLVVSLALAVAVLIHPWIAMVGIILFELLSTIYPDFGIPLTPNRVLGALAVGILVSRSKRQKEALRFDRFDMAFWALLIVGVVGRILYGTNLSGRSLVSDMITGYILFWLVVNLVTSWNMVKMVLMSMLVVMLWLALYSISRYLEDGLRPDEVRFVAFGSGATTNLLGVNFYLALVVCLWITQLIEEPVILRPLLYGATIPLGIAMLLTGSRAPLSATIASAFVLIFFGLGRNWHPVRTFIVIVLPMMAVVWVFNTDQLQDTGFDRAISSLPFVPDSSSDLTVSSDSRRSDLFVYQAQVFFENPIIGRGFGNATVGFSEKATSSHSVFLSTLASTGLVGFALLVYLYGFAAHKLYQAYLVVREPHADFAFAQRYSVIALASLFVGRNIVIALVHGDIIDRIMFVVFGLMIAVSNLILADAQYGSHAESDCHRSE